MTIASQTSRISYTGDGSTTAFPVSFYFAANVDLVVILQDTAGNQATQILGTNYNLTGATFPAGGTCTFTVAPTSGYLVTIYRDPAVTQTTSYNNNDPFPAKSHELALDKLTTLVQRLKDQFSRAVRQSEGEGALTTTLATVAARKNKLLGFDGNGALVYAVGPTFVGTTATGVAVVDTRATAAITTFAGSINAIVTTGLATVGDGSGATYARGTIASLGAFLDGGGTQYWGIVSSGGSGGGGGLRSPGGRITLTSGTPVMGSSVASATTVYYSPYAGNTIPIYDGTVMVATTFAEISQTTTDTVKSPAAVAATKIYDLFVWNDAGTIRCTRGPAWTNLVLRGYTLTLVNGTLLNTSTITNGPAALRGTYVGTIGSNSGSTIDFIYGTAGSSGLAGVFNVWNAYNRVNVGCMVIDTAASYTYTSATIRQAHASTAMQVSFLVGISEDAVTANYTNLCTTSGLNAINSVQIGLGFDSITTFSTKGFFQPGVANTLTGTPSAYAIWNPGVGSHYVAALEASDSLNANTFNVSGSGSIDGLSFSFRM